MTYIDMVSHLCELFDVFSNHLNNKMLYYTSCIEMVFHLCEFFYAYSRHLALWTKPWGKFFENFEIMASIDWKNPETYFSSVKVPLE